VLNALGKPLVVTGFVPNAKTGQSLFDSAAANAGYERPAYTFDGHALRRCTLKAKGKAARRKDKHARRTGVPA